MKPTRTAKAIRVSAKTERSLVRVRTTRKGRAVKSRVRPRVKRLPEKLRAIRERLNLSQGAMAHQIGVDNRASISGYERGEREPPLPVLLAYARQAGIAVEVLIDDKLDLPK